jgi:hypothetical protein
MLNLPLESLLSTLRLPPARGTDALMRDARPCHFKGPAISASRATWHLQSQAAEICLIEVIVQLMPNHLDVFAVNGLVYSSCRGLTGKWCLLKLGQRFWRCVQR